MNPELQPKSTRPGSKKILAVSLICFILLMFGITAQLTYTVLKHEGVYQGVSINGTDVGGMSREEAAGLLEKNFQQKIKDIELTLKTEKYSSKFKYSDLKVEYNVPEAIEKAYDVGRTGSIFTRLYDIYIAGKEGKNVDMQVIFNSEKLDEVIQQLYDKTLIKVKEADLLVSEEKTLIRSGHHGESIDKAKTAAAIENMIKEAEGGTLEIPLIITAPGKINVDAFYSQIVKEAANATTKVEKNNVTVVPHVVGQSVEKSELLSIVQELEKKENTERVVPVKQVIPEITTDKVNASLFKDTLASMHTQFSTNDENNRNRGENIKIAVGKINGKVLAPGEIFSFNQVVGPRTEAGGFKIAHTYVAGKIVDGIGGGICQVSTTLYNSVLYSDLDVIERRNHMFTVGYATKGQDATVSYNDVDFKFKNSTRWPLKIEAWVTSSNKIFFVLKGTNENPGKKIEIVPKILKTVEFKTKYIDDPNLPEGKTEVKQKGMTGYTVETYKIVKQDGKVISQTKLHTSVYKPLDQEVIRGTKKATAAAAPPTPAPTQTPHEPGVDDAENPPAEQ